MWPLFGEMCKCCVLNIRSPCISNAAGQECLVDLTEMKNITRYVKNKIAIRNIAKCVLH